MRDKNEGRPPEAQTQEVENPPEVSNPVCACKHSLGAHKPAKGCVFCGCQQFRVEMLAEVLLQGQPAPAVDLVSNHAAFRDVEREHVLDLVRAGRPRQFSKGANIMREGDLGDRLYLILTGTVKVTTAEGELARLGPGEFVGEMATLFGAQRSATVTANQDVLALELTAADLRDVFRQDADLVLGFSRLVRQRQTGR